MLRLVSICAFGFFGEISCLPRILCVTPAVMSSAVVVIALTAAAVTVLYLYTNNTRRLNDIKDTLRKLPLIGELHSSPIATPLVNWSAWSKDHGPITKAELFGIVPIIVINSYEAVTELFSRRSQ